ncbi:hypothetical protein TNCV_347201 [Trichonephila clavipes]|nr:hypothetical protein TNCV_347201 [Trichonephila clavipes]
MDIVDFVHHENPSTWTGVESATFGVQGQRQTNYGTPSRHVQLSTNIGEKRLTHAFTHHERESVELLNIQTLNLAEISLLLSRDAL